MSTETSAHHVRSLRASHTRAMLAIGVLLGVACAMASSPVVVASDLDPETPVGALGQECVGREAVFVFGQVWQDQPSRDAVLLEDAGISGVDVALDLEGVEPTVTDPQGFYGFCVDNPELWRFPTTVSVVLPPGQAFVPPGLGPEDQDSDIEDDGRTAEFVISEVLGGGTEQFEITDRTAMRIDIGMLSVGVFEPSNPCPGWSIEAVDADPNGDWDGDGITNSRDSDPCGQGPIDPCPDWSQEFVEVDPAGDWDGDGILNAADDDPCNPPDVAPVNPCPVWNAELVEADASADWDGDGVSNIEDDDPCTPSDVEPVNPCPVSNAELVEADPNGDWDGDGVLNANDEQPCVAIDITTTTTTTVAPVESTVPPVTVESDGGGGGDGGGGFPWVIVVLVGLVILGVVGWVLVSKAGGGSGGPQGERDDDEKKQTRGIIVGGVD